MDGKRTWYIAQIRLVNGDYRGPWEDDCYLPDGGVNGRARMEELRKDPEIAHYEVQAIRRTEEVLDL